MKRVCGVIVVGALVLASAVSPAAAKLNSCEGPIVLGTTISVMALDAATWSKNYFDMVSQMNPKPKSVFWIVQDNLVTKAVQEHNAQFADNAGIKTVGIESFAGSTRNFAGIVLKIKAAQP